MEIGSEFWLDDIFTEEKGDGEWIRRFGNTVLTSSGRGAISLLLQQVKPKIKTALLPSYICESVISPFIKEGFDCSFYDITSDLSPDLESIKEIANVGIFLHMGYFGFPTNQSLLDIITELKSQGTIIVEDITHSLLSHYSRFDENEYYVASIRKWMGLPSGGLLASPIKRIKSNLQQNEVFASIRREALFYKKKYILNNEANLKQQYQILFAKGETLLSEDIAPWDIDKLSLSIINRLNIKEVMKRRTSNFLKLSEGMNGINCIEPVVVELTEKVCPMFYPVYIRNDRNDIQKWLSNNQIYCPVHWPMPKQIVKDELIKASMIYDTILSIPCDQRYESNDMDRVVSVFQELDRKRNYI